MYTSASSTPLPGLLPSQPQSHFLLLVVVVFIAGLSRRCQLHGPRQPVQPWGPSPYTGRAGNGPPYRWLWCDPHKAGHRCCHGAEHVWGFRGYVAGCPLYVCPLVLHLCRQVHHWFALPSSSGPPGTLQPLLLEAHVVVSSPVRRLLAPRIVQERTDPHLLSRGCRSSALCPLADQRDARLHALPGIHDAQKPSSPC